MSTDIQAGQSPAPNSNLSKITKKQWLIWASVIAAILVLTYTLLHSFLYQKIGEKTHQLSKTEFAAVTSITQSDTTASPTRAQYRVQDYLFRIMDIKNPEAVTNMIKTQGVKDISYLSTYPFRVKSYFWLTDYWVLLEVIFWSLFGLTANLMYSVTRTREEDVDGDGVMDKPEVFDANRIPEHFGKFWYTPIISVVLFLSIDYLTASGEVSETPEGTYVVVFAFILGFFSRRTVALLRKLKDLFFPNDTTTTTTVSDGQNVNPNPDNGSLDDNDNNTDDGTTDGDTPNPDSGTNGTDSTSDSGTSDDTNDNAGSDTGSTITNPGAGTSDENNPNPNSGNTNTTDATSDDGDTSNSAAADSSSSSTSAITNADSSTSNQNDSNPTSDSANDSSSDASPAPITSVTVGGKVKAAASLGLKSYAGTVIDVYTAADSSTVIQSVTLARGSDGSFTFEHPLGEGEYSYSAHKTLSKASYSAHGDFTVTGESATQQLTVKLVEDVG